MHPTDYPARFISEMKWANLPESVRHQARRCLLDTLGAGLAGRQTALSGIIHEFVVTAYGGTGARLWLDGRSVSPSGAALANGMTIDSLDIHDGFTLTKGHAGAAVVPSAIATLSMTPDRNQLNQGQELLATLAVGYEIALRAGRALHATACDYHTSGAWNALGCAAVTCRRLGSSIKTIRHALGIAEYHGPRSPMMRCIDYPTMLKDGSGWGAMAGVSAGQLAHLGFTGAPAALVESEEVVEFWADLGNAWLFEEQYFKPYAVCRWAQPAIAGALALRRRHDFALTDIKRIKIVSFHEAVRLSKKRPANTEEAQYSLPFPVAAALVHGQIGPEELQGAGLIDPQVLDLSDKIELAEDEEMSGRFPSERLAKVQIEVSNGVLLDSGIMKAAWGADAPPSDEALREKFRWLASSSLPTGKALELEALIWHVDAVDDLSPLISLLAEPAWK